MGARSEGQRGVKGSKGGEGGVKGANGGEGSKEALDQPWTSLGPRAGPQASLGPLAGLRPWAGPPSLLLALSPVAPTEAVGTLKPSITYPHSPFLPSSPCFPLPLVKESEGEQSILYARF